jgi:hypothetical protein
MVIALMAIGSLIGYLLMARLTLTGFCIDDIHRGCTVDHDMNLLAGWLWPVALVVVTVSGIYIGSRKIVEAKQPGEKLREIKRVEREARIEKSRHTQAVHTATHRGLYGRPPDFSYRYSDETLW